MAARSKENPSSTEIDVSSEKPCEALFLDNQVCFALYTTTRLLTQAYQRYLGPLDLTYPQYLVMLVLWEFDGLNVSELGNKLLLDSGTLSPLLKKLEQKKLIVRKRQIQDERNVTLHLTSNGRELKSKAKVIPEKMICHSGLPIQELIQLKRQLEELSRNLKPDKTKTRQKSQATGSKS